MQADGGGGDDAQAFGPDARSRRFRGASESWRASRSARRSTASWGAVVDGALALAGRVAAVADLLETGRTVLRREVFVRPSVAHRPWRSSWPTGTRWRTVGRMESEHAATSVRDSARAGAEPVGDATRATLPLRCLDHADPGLRRATVLA